MLIQDSGLHSPWGTVADGLGTVVWLAFSVELALTLFHAHDRRAALRAHWRAEGLLTHRRNLPYIAALTLLLVTVTGIAVHETDLGRFPNPWRGLWFAIVTVTTVGYGDTFPTSAGGASSPHS